MIFILLLIFLIKISCLVDVHVKDGVVRDLEESDELNSFDLRNNVIGPESLYFLDGMCFKTLSSKYFEIEVCPFHNVTQRRLSGTKTTLQGIWGNWNYTQINPENTENTENNENNNKEIGHESPESLVWYSDMLFDRGDKCTGGSERSASLHFGCIRRSDIERSEDVGKDTSVSVQENTIENNNGKNNENNNESSTTTTTTTTTPSLPLDELLYTAYSPVSSASDDDNYNSSHDTDSDPTVIDSFIHIECNSENFGPSKCDIECTLYLPFSCDALIGSMDMLPSFSKSSSSSSSSDTGGTYSNDDVVVSDQTNTTTTTTTTPTATCPSCDDCERKLQACNTALNLIQGVETSHTEL